MRLEPVLLSYAGLACLALSSQRPRRELGLATLPTVTAARIAGLVLILLACWRAVHHFGPYQGPVAFVGMISIGGLPLVLIMSRWPKASLMAGIAAATLALGSSWSTAAL